SITGQAFQVATLILRSNQIRSVPGDRVRDDALRDRDRISHKPSGKFHFDLARFFRAALAPSFPRAVRVFLGRRAIVFFRRATLAAFLIFRFARPRCFLVATSSGTRSILVGSSARCESRYVLAATLSRARCFLRGRRTRSCRALPPPPVAVSRQCLP